MNTDKVIKELENRGYTVTDESGVLMISGKYLNLDDAMTQIKKDLEALDFHGSWGTKGYPKGKVPKITRPVLEEKTDDPGEEDETYEIEELDETEEAGTVDKKEKAGVDVGADSDAGSDTDSTGEADTGTGSDASSDTTDSDDYLDDSDDSLDDDDDPFEGLDHIREINDFDSDDFGQMSFNFL